MFRTWRYKRWILLNRCVIISLQQRTNVVCCKLVTSACNCLWLWTSAWLARLTSHRGRRKDNREPNRKQTQPPRAAEASLTTRDEARRRFTAGTGSEETKPWLKTCSRHNLWTEDLLARNQRWHWEDEVKNALGDFYVFPQFQPTKKKSNFNRKIGTTLKFLYYRFYWIKNRKIKISA